MGRPMAEAMLAGGANLVAHDVRPATDFGEFAAHLVPVESLREVATLFSIVRDIPQTEALLFGDQAMASAPNLTTLVISSTVAPSYIHDLRRRLPTRVALIDAPMSGAPVAARERRLAFMLGGDTAHITPLMPLFDAMGTNIHHLGPLGAGMVMKVLNNMIAASSVATTRLALDWAAEAGISGERFREVAETSSGQTWFSRHFAAIDWAEEAFDPANTMGILVKDVTSALDTAPAGATTALPRAIINAIRTLK
ncbi:NAD(P)-dependent oxidoreductase [Algicella marina]|nr:NAD(P)-binding domain-containing protein [Algicella marina]